MIRRKLVFVMALLLFVFLGACTDKPIETENPTPEGTLESISVTGPTKKNYYTGDTLDLAGLVVVAHYSDDTEVTLAAADYSVSAFDSSYEGTREIVVTYQGLTAGFNVYVTKEVVGMDLTPPTKLIYDLGEPFDARGLVVHVLYADDSRASVPAAEYTVTGFDSSATGVITITVTYATYTKTFDVTIKEPDLAPQVTGIIHHWMPGAIDATITATVDLSTAEASTFGITYGETALVEFLDYELTGENLVIFGNFLHVNNIGLGEHIFNLTSENGTTPFTVTVVNDPRGTSIPTQVIQGVNMEPVENFVPTAPIANAPELLITEVSSDMALYTFIEVFNNTAAPYNLKGHRIVFANLTLQTMIVSDDLYEQPLGMAAAAYIYQDYIIPALSKATIWIVAAYPWTVDTAVSGDVDPARRIIEPSDIASKVFGPNAENLSISKFKNVWNLGEDDLVFPVRPQYMIHNNTSAYSSVTGLGQPVAKSASAQWADINTSIDNRGIQIQKVDQETYFPVGSDTTGPVGSAFYRYEWLVTNKEEDVYVNGVLDRTKLQAYGTPGTSNYRESINGLAIRKVYFDASHVELGYATATTYAIDAYNANRAPYLAMYAEAVTPIVTAIVYGNVVMEADVVTNTKWGSMKTMEYTVPAEGSTLMRFIPRSTETLYSSYYAAEDALRDYKLSGITVAVPETMSNVDVVVPVSPAYPTTYLTNGYNTVSKTGWYNFYLTKPTA